MSFPTKVKLWLSPKKDLRQQAERAYGTWLASPHNKNATTYISEQTGIPRDEVWGIIFGRNNNA